ncbi:MAG: HU family DNA-binding protein [Limnochordia bacterium]|jgi:DNA-binding protein HU-beta|nr:HU family DNA-binding protein [Bacillota bacterium]
MTKGDLIDSVAEKAAITKKDAGRVVDAVFNTIMEALAQGDKVQLVGFGTFEVRHRAARTGRNPQTGETIDIEARNMPVFRAGKSLKEAVQ